MRRARSSPISVGGAFPPPEGSIVIRFVRRLHYRDRVHEYLNALLMGYPSGRQFADDFPGLPSAIRSHFDSGLSAPSAALDLAAEIICALLGQLGTLEKGRVLQALRQPDRDEAAALASRRIAGDRERVPDPVSFLTQLASLAIFMAKRMTEEGTLRSGEYAAFLERIERTAGG